ncbi:MAG TPA: HAD family hydrolase [Aggregatilineales bacterium]|nr:HAD family hydrolase [Aggregatilineales bacterium]
MENDPDNRFQSMNTILFFDLDGTVMQNAFSGIIFPQISRMIGDAAGVSPDSIAWEIMQEHNDRLQNPLDDRPRSLDWEDIIQTIAARHQVAFTGSVVALVEAYAFEPHIAVLDDAPRLLKELHNGRKLVVATMGLSVYQYPVLRALNLYPLFDDFLMPDTTGFLKTDREFYRHYPDEDALRIHIGDRYDHDCYYPKRFGSLAVIRLPLSELAKYSPFERPRHLLAEHFSDITTPFDVLPDAVVIDLAELPEVIEALEAQSIPQK